MFIKMCSDTDKSFIDPGPVVKGIVDDDGKMIKIGDEEDIGEVSEKFLSCLDLPEMMETVDMPSTQKPRRSMVMKHPTGVEEAKAHKAA